jgi:hypothetical protein
MNVTAASRRPAARKTALIVLGRASETSATQPNPPTTDHAEHEGQYRQRAGAAVDSREPDSRHR